MAKELAGRFKEGPRNIYLLGAAYLRLEDEAKYTKIVDLLRNRSRNETSKKKALIWNKRALYLEASHLLFHDRYEKARSKLDAILSQPDPESDPLMLAWPLVKKGMSYDLEAKWDEASTYYKKILEMKNGAGAQFLAQKYLDKPAQRGDPFLAY